MPQMETRDEGREEWSGRQPPPHPTPIVTEELEGERRDKDGHVSENAVRLISRTAKDVNRGLGMENPKNRAKAPVWQA